jgi:hypothetical protein
MKTHLTPMRGLNKLRSAHVISTGHAFVQNVRRGYELGVDVHPRHRIPGPLSNSSTPSDRAPQRSALLTFRHRNSALQLGTDAP